MRRFMDVLVGAAVLGLGAGVAVYFKRQADADGAIAETGAMVRQLQSEIHLKGAAGVVDVNGRGWPVTIDPRWFGEGLPRNLLLKGSRPWLELAPTEHAQLEHPLDRVAFDESAAAFWYNPGNGVVRARVPATVSDRRATELYNLVNGTSLSSVLDAIAPPVGAAANDVAEDEKRDPERGASLKKALGDLDPTRPRPDDPPR